MEHILQALYRSPHMSLSPCYSAEALLVLQGYFILFYFEIQDQ